jgi:hypothetical protein
MNRLFLLSSLFISQRVKNKTIMTTNQVSLSDKRLAEVNRSLGRAGNISQADTICNPNIHLQKSVDPDFKAFASLI